MSNDPRMIKKEKKITPVTIAPAKVSLKRFNKKAKCQYRQWLEARKLRTWCIKIPEVISEGGEKEYIFCEQQEAAAAEAERWEKKKSEERQRQLQEKYQRLKQDREQQQQQQQQQQRKQKQQKKKQLQNDDDDDTVITELHKNPHWTTKNLNST